MSANRAVNRAADRTETLSTQPAQATAIVLPGVPQSVRAARKMVRSQLGDDHPAADAAALAVSELATNALLYSRSGLPGGTFAVSVQAMPGGVLIRVRDAGARTMPILADQAPGSEHGFGLRIVAALAAAWGTEPAGAERVTWCEIVNGPPYPATEGSAPGGETCAPLASADLTVAAGTVSLPAPRAAAIADAQGDGHGGWGDAQGDAQGDGRSDAPGDGQGDAALTLPGSPAISGGAR
jgi:serine/threonine-protein kinase RsbW